MRKQRLVRPLSIVLNEQQRTTIENLAESQECTIGAAARFLIDRGIKAAGLQD